MLGRAVRLIAATAALSFLSISGASAFGFGWSSYGGGYGYGGGCCGAPVAPVAPPVNWGCGSSCAPLSAYGFGSGCGSCAPVRWGCCNSYSSYGYGAGYGYGYGNGYGYGAGYGYQQPTYMVQQGPMYEPPATGYAYPVSTYSEPSDYPYVTGYRGYRGYSESYRPAYRPRVAYYHQRHRYEGYPAYRHRSYHGSRRGYWRPVELPPK